MNVGIVLPGGLDPSGEERTIPALRAVVSRLARQHDVRVVVLSQPGTPASWVLDGVRVFRSGRPALVRLPRLLRREHRRQPFHLLHAFWASTGAAVAARVASAAGVPLVVHVAGGELVRLDAQGYGGARSLRGRLMARYALGRAAVVTAATAPMCLAAARLATRVERVPLGVDITRWAVCPPRARGAGPLRLAWVGSINRVKGPEVMAATVAALARRRLDFTLDVVGEDILRGAVHSRIAALDLGGRVRFRGWLRQSELHALLRGVDVLLHTAWHEAGPVVVLEAALVGVPTVGTAVGHIAEWAPTAAVAAPAGDVGALARGIEALAADDARRLALAGAAQDRALAADADGTARRLLALYEELVR